jgi:glycosyltransferase involved in cell wall biosynthesis
MSNQSVLILLATHNGESYIRPMIDSVLAQDHADLRIIVSDDNSTDGTPAILTEYANTHPDKITHYRSDKRFGSAQKHFMHLLEQFHDQPYIMFCDQDDVWHPDKVSKTLALMKTIETDSATPSMVHTDLRVVDGDLQQIAPSFCAHSAIDGHRLALNQLLVQNVVTGCTMMINRRLAKMVCKHYDPEAMMMHDWWIALLACACGKVAFLDEATIDYRQHGKNSVGAKNVYSPAYLLKRLQSDRMRKALADAAGQAEAFVKCYREWLTIEQQELVVAFAKTRNASLFVRNRIYSQYNLKKYGLIRVVTQYLGW